MIKFAPSFRVFSSLFCKPFVYQGSQKTIFPTAKAYISFPRLLEQITTDLVAESNTRLVSYSPAGQKSDLGLPGLRSGSRQGWFLPGGAGREYVSLLFPASRGRHAPWLVTPSSNFTAMPIGFFCFCFLHLITLVLSLWSQLLPTLSSCLLPPL